MRANERMDERVAQYSYLSSCIFWPTVRCETSEVGERLRYLETVGANVFGGLIATVTNVGHLVLALEATAHSIINALKE